MFFVYVFVYQVIWLLLRWCIYLSSSLFFHWLSIYLFIYDCLPIDWFWFIYAFIIWMFFYIGWLQEECPPCIRVPSSECQSTGSASLHQTPMNSLCFVIQVLTGKSSTSLLPKTRLRRNRKPKTISFPTAFATRKRYSLKTKLQSYSKSNYFFRQALGYFIIFCHAVFLNSLVNSFLSQAYFSFLPAPPGM